MEGGFVKRGQYNQKHCSPKKDKTKFSCLSKKAIHKIAHSLNKIKGIHIKTRGLSDKELYDKISRVIKNNFNCKTEACWLKIRKLMSNLSKKDATYFRRHFRPEMPKDIVDDYTEWISNFDIKLVLDQHHEETEGVYSYGAVPIDFRKCSVSHDLCRIDIHEHLKHGKTKLCIVFNTDDSSGPGKHWMSMFVDLLGKNLENQPGIYFFDSFGSKPVKEVKELIKKIQDQGSKIKKEFIVANNEKSYQHNNFSCGFYCMHFLEHMIKGYPFKKYLNSGLTDKKMIEYRTHCYLDPKEIKC